MGFELLRSLNHLYGGDPVIDAQFLQNIESIHHVAEGCITAIDEVQAAGVSSAS